MSDPKPIDPLKQIDNALVEPARFGLRKVGAGLGKVASAGLVAGGSVLGLFGGLLMAIATGSFVTGLGGVSLAAGATFIFVGALGFWTVGRVDNKADTRAVERRMLKLIAAHGTLTDATIAQRITEKVTTVREVANKLVKAGVIDVDIDPQSGDDVYKLAENREAGALPPAAEDELSGFEARVRQGAQAPIDAAAYARDEQLAGAPTRAPVVVEQTTPVAVEQTVAEPAYEER